MTSHIPGFEYDIFISYRHNDNKGPGGQPGEGWVTEFVNNLSTELESTVKGVISIYFDKNPHDGLLETHQVEDSLSDKLKTLIFIPIVSQTYCDPEAYAWQKEFQPFIRTAAVDKFGLAVKLPGGNVSSRILPVRIHDLEVADVKLLETELNGRLRSIDFVFKSPGVNRPLRAHEVDPLKNSNHTLYRDQLNKTANAIKEILSGMKQTGTPAKTYDIKSKPLTTPVPSKSLKVMAVLPFKSQHPEDDYLGDGLAEELIKSLSRIRDLKIVDRSLSFALKNSNLPLVDLIEKTGSGSLVEGALQRQKDQIKITIKLVNASGATLWTEIFDRKMDQLIDLLPEVALVLANQVKATIREPEKSAVLKVPTHHAKAHDRYLMGRYLLNGRIEIHKCISCFGEAIAFDLNFALPHAGMSEAYVLLGYQNQVPFAEAVEKAKASALKALEMDPTLAEAYLPLAFISMGYEWNWPEAEPNFSKVFALNPQNPSARERYGLYMKQILGNFIESESDPIITVPHFLKAYALLHRGKFEEALAAAQKALELEPDSFMANRAVGLSYLGMEKYEQAIEALLAASRLSNRHHWLLFELMGAYMLSGRLEEAQGVMEEALARANTLPAKVFNFLFPGQT